MQPETPLRIQRRRTRDLPILFSGPMVRALLDGRKAETRRVIKPQPEPFMVGEGDAKQECKVGILHVEGDPRPRVTLGCVITPKKVRHALGDLLWVRESFAKVGDNEDDIHGCPDLRIHAYYKADAICPECCRWRPSIHMPRWASRITLLVRSVRVERLQEITGAGAQAEGVPFGYEHHPIAEVHGAALGRVFCSTCFGWGTHGALGANLGVTEVDCVDCDTPRKLFRNLWHSLHARDGFGWDANPWVTVTQLEVIRGNIDEVRSRVAEVLA